MSEVRAEGLLAPDRRCDEAIEDAEHKKALKSLAKSFRPKGREDAKDR
jgi:hypothetical protein